jgi:hypothetical protein
VRVLALAVVVAACDGGGDVVDVPAFRFTQPEGIGEIYPDGVARFDVAWETDATADRGLEIELRLEGTNPVGATYAGPRAALVDGHALWGLGAGPSGTFQLVGDILDGDDTLATFTSPAIIIVQGAKLRDAELTLPDANGERDLWVTVSTASVLVLELVAVPDANPTARTSLGRISVASDLAPIGRVFAWDAALAAGDYTVVAEVSANDDAVRYTDGMSVVHWNP